jgi:oligo-1,6-glucosidase
VPPDAVPDLTGAEVLLATHANSTSLELQPWESRIYLLG